MDAEFQRDDEVEDVIAHRTWNDTRYFLVRLKHSKCRVWIPSDGRRILDENLILDYYTRHAIVADDLPAIGRHKRADDLFRLLSRVTDDELNAFARRFANLDSLPASNANAVKAEIYGRVPPTGEILLSDAEMAELRAKVLVEVCRERRETQVEELRRTEWSLNMAADNDEPIYVRNDVDFAPFPRFKYVNRFVAGVGVRIEKTPSDNWGCGVDTPSGGRHTCDRRCLCLGVFDQRPAYDRNGLLVLQPGELIHECNAKCRCDDACRFRVIQRNSKVPLLIFRCLNGTGWGVKTRRRLPKGAYIGRYFGKVILWEEAESLPSVAGRKDYLFDMDFIIGDDGHCKYTVDAFEYGNFTRFVNHSCSPNLVVHHAWINMMDDNLHDLAFFTCRPVECGEELTFDYTENFTKNFTHCQCGSYECIRRRRL